MIRARCLLLAACMIVAAAPALASTPPAAPAKKGTKSKPAPPHAAAAPAPVPVDEPKQVVMDLAVGGGTLSRRLTYRDDLYGAFHNSLVRWTGQLSASLAIYPFAPITRGFFGQLGLYGDIAHSTRMTTTYGPGESYATLAVAYDVGLRVRIPIGSVELDPTFGYGRQQADMGTLPGTPSPGPNFDLGFLFADLHGRWQATGALSLLFDGAYLGVIQNGLAESGTFPRSTVAGLDFGGGLGVKLIEALELRLLVSYQRFVYSMNSQPGDANVAGGATDEYLWGTLALAVLIH